jgi:PAS domain S-box-containing protein
MGQEKGLLKEASDLHAQMLAAYLEGLPSAAAIKDLEGHFIYVNPAWEKAFQKSREEWLEKTSAELWPPTLATQFNEQDHAVLRTGKPLVTLGTLRQAEKPHHWIYSKFLMVDADLNPLMIGINAIDITEHLEARLRLEHWLESSPTVIYTREPRGAFATTYISENIQTLLGWEPQHFLADPRFWDSLIYPEDRPRILEQLALPWPEDHQTLEYRVRTQDGAYRWMHDSCKLLRDKTGHPVEIAGALQDITARKTLETQLQQAQRQAVLGRLARGVAHDFNNLLMAIMGYGELMRTSLSQTDPLLPYIDDILKATDRAASLTQQLLAFSRLQMSRPQEIDLNQVVTDLEKLLGRLLGEHLELNIVVAPDLGRITADPGQLGQIIINLTVNARDAMTTGNRLTLETANVEFATSHQGRFNTIPPGRYVALSFTDNGAGRETASLVHTCEPPFPAAETGLGLSVVQGLVLQNGGYLDVDRQSGQGAVVTIYLPRSENAVEPTQDGMRMTEKLQGSETILIVEDDPALHTLLVQVFSRYGYEVLEARDGGEAWLIAERHQGPIHLMVTDVVLPRMSGRELAERLAPLHPEMQVFYMSGYPDSDLALYGIPEVAQTIAKPFRPLDLVKKVRECLDVPEAVIDITTPPA